LGAVTELAGAEFCRAAGLHREPVHRNGQEQSASVPCFADNRGRGGHFHDGRPAVEIMFLNMRSAAMVGQTRNSL
jgi:hypothetical protein